MLQLLYLLCARRGQNITFLPLKSPAEVDFETICEGKSALENESFLALKNRNDVSKSIWFVMSSLESICSLG